MNTTSSGTEPHGLARLGVIVVAAGRGERLGAETPKAFTRLRDRTLVEYAIRTVTAISEPGQLVLVVPEGYAAHTLELVEAAMPAASNWQVSIAHGGRERHESVLFGIEALHESIEVVLVHDAARPLTPLDVFERVIAGVRATRGSIIPTIAVSDTLKQLGSQGEVLETVDRATLAAVQTPQGFTRETLTAAHNALRASSTGELPTDDAELVQRAGSTVRTVAGSHHSHKITVAADVCMLEGLLAHDDEQARDRRTTDRAATVAPLATGETAS